MRNPQHDAADPQASVWVTASAGTGKTKVLTDRVLRLLLNGTEPARILCLTFTRAAAAEMSIRISSTLGDWITADDTVLDEALQLLLARAPGDAEIRRARSLFAEVLDTPGGMKILTIHAFCQSLLRRFPVEAGIAPHFAVADERTQSELLKEAQNRTFGHARYGADEVLARALYAITAQLGEDKFADLINEWTSARARLQGALEERSGSEGLAAAAARLLSVDCGVSEETLLKAACAEGVFDREGLVMAAAALMDGSKTDFERSGIISDWLAVDEPARLIGFGVYCRAFLRKDGGPLARLATKSVLKLTPNMIDILTKEQSRLLAFQERLKALAVAENSAALIHFGVRLLDNYRDEKTVRAMLDYDDQIMETRKLLAAPDIAPWVLFKLDGGLDHILVDESQDTSPAQWAVIDALSEEFFVGESSHEDRRTTVRTIFSVGDEKQSIFSFQGADPPALLETREKFQQRVEGARHQWREVPLERSFRSTAAVLDAVDAVFALPQAQAGVVQPGQQLHHQAVRVGQGGRVELWPAAVLCETPKDAPWSPPMARRGSDDPAHRLAGAIAKKISDWLNGTPGPGSDGWLESKGRPIRAGDIMILVRQRGSFAATLVRALKTRRVEVAGVDRMNLTEQLAVMDLMALGDFVLLPGDDLTLACLLKGPFIGFSEDRLFELAHKRAHSSLWQTLNARRDENIDFSRAHETLSALLTIADYKPPFEFYNEFLGAGGGRQQLLQRLGMEAADPIDEFLSAALSYEHQHPPSLQGFLHWLRAAKTELKRDPERARDEVQVMTVHGAKGLQAPIVFMPDTMSLPGDRRAILWAKGDVPFWPGRRAREERLSRDLRDASRTQDLEEYRRLLYVAMTRAEDRLYISGWHGAQKAQDGCWYELIQEGLARLEKAEELELSFVGAEGWSGQAWALSCLQTSAVSTTGPPPERDQTETLPDHFLQPASPEQKLSHPIAPSRLFGIEPPVRGPLTEHGASTFMRGRLIHRLLETLPELSPEKRPDAASRYLARSVHGLSAKEQKVIVAEVLAVLEEPAAAPLFGPGSRAEVPLAAVLGETVVSGQVDRLLVTEDQVLVADYKSGCPASAVDSKIPLAYLVQMAGYYAVLQAIFPGREIRAALLFTDGPELIWLQNSLLKLHAP